ncbi:MAG: hypothetical protein RhofKO_01310 [Rhodothermales bacterium]
MPFARFCLTLIFLLVGSPLLAFAQPSTADSTQQPTGIAALVTGSGALGGYADAYYQLDTLNAGLPAPEHAANLQTPQATLEHFVRASRDLRFADAGLTLNLNLFPDAQQANLAPVFAQQLYYVLDTQLGFGWSSLSDRPDGASLQPTSPNDPLVGQPRRSVLLGSLTLGARDIAIRLQRVRVGDGAPIWVFSPQTVENIVPLYDAYGPGPIDSIMPEWARRQVLGQTALWAWLAFLLGIALVALFTWWVRRLTCNLFEDADSHWIRGLGQPIATPLAVFAGMLVLYLFTKLTLALGGFVTTSLLILTISSFIWLAMRGVGYLTEHLAEERGTDDLQELISNEHDEQQKWLTYLSVGRRVLLFVVFLFGIGLMVSQFRSLQTLGFSLMASAGVATVLLGIAAQPLLGNIIASIQIALAKPVRIGDSIYYKGNWGFVEDITYTYILIQIWDNRRLVIPLRYFLSHPIENWTIRDAHLVKPIYLYADYTLDVDRVREKFDALLRADEEWDEEHEPTVQVTSAGDETIEIRALCSAKDPSTAWGLHCRLREQLVAFLRDLDDGKYLPRRRLTMQGERSPQFDSEAEPSNGRH